MGRVKLYTDPHIPYDVKVRWSKLWCLWNVLFMLQYDAIHSLYSYRGIDMMSYEANFASHHTRDCHVRFLSAHNSIGKNKKMFCYFLFSSNPITKLQPSDKSISTHTQLKFQTLPWSKSKVTALFVIVSIPPCTKGNQKRMQNNGCVSAYRIVQTLCGTKFGTKVGTIYPICWQIVDISSSVAMGSCYFCYALVLHLFCVVISSIMVQDR